MTINVPTRRVSFVSLGCAKNLVDSEVMIGKLGAAGWELVPEAADADAIVRHHVRVHRSGQGRIDRRHPGPRAGQTPRSAADRCGLPLAAFRCRAAIADPRDRRRDRDRRVCRDRRAARRRAGRKATAAARFRSRARARLSAAPDHHALGDGLPQDRRRLRSPVHVLHHPAAARRVPLAVRRIDSHGGRAR